MSQIELPQGMKSNERASQTYQAPMGIGNGTDIPNVGVSDSEQGDMPGIKRSYLSSDKKANKPFIVIVGAIGIIVLFSMFFHHPATKQQPGAKVSAQPAAGGPVAQTNQSNLPTDLQTQAAAPVNKQDTTADDIQHTRGADQTGQPLGSIQNFNSQEPGANGQWTPPLYSGSTAVSGQGRSDKEADIRLAQVTKPSLTFVLTSTDIREPAHLASDSPELLVTNFGYEPGFHIATHLESVVTTATKAPAIAVVDFDYRRNGIVVIPAGARVIGEIEQATSTGVVGLHFTSIHLPDGEDIAVNAVGLDQRMGPLKGAVTGRNRGKEFALAALSGLGSTAAMFAGNNVNGTLSEADLIRGQAAQNVGQAADSQIQQLAVTEHLIVTVAAGTQVQVTFVSPAKKKPEAQTASQN
jgi:hypothetical protein